MGIAILLFGLVVGIFHFQSQEPDPGDHQSLAAAPVEPGNYREPGGAEKQPTVLPVTVASSPYAALAEAGNSQQMAPSASMVAGSETGSASQGDM
jgi:hypothetical protein